MPFDYLTTFPIPIDVMSPRLRGLLEPIGLSPSQFVEVPQRPLKEVAGVAYHDVTKFAQPASTDVVALAGLCGDSRLLRPLKVR